MKFSCGLKHVPIKITVAYIVSGVLWILFSDRILEGKIHDINTIKIAQTYKGWFYVFVTGILLYWLIHRYTNVMCRSQQELMESKQEIEAAYNEISAAEEELKERLEALMESRKALEKSEERFRLAVEGANDAIWDWDIQENDTYIFPRTKQMLGYDEEDIGNTLEDLKSLIHPEDVDRVMNELNQHLEGLTPYYMSEYRIRTKGGQYKWIMSRGKAIRDINGKPIRMAGSHTDITERKETEKKIYKLAYYDFLSDLPNRAMFEKTLINTLRKARKENKKVTIFYIDLDEFKTVNDTVGHEYGKMLLSEAGSILRDIVGETDFAARIGGDEFAIILVHNGETADIKAYANRVLEAFQKTWHMRGNEFYITASIGVTTYPDDALDKESLLRNADTAMYAAKKAGKNTFCLYTKDMNETLLKAIKLENELRRALDKNQLEVYYQPQINIKTGQVVGVEALLRWKRLEYGIVLPGHFIKAAENTGLIIPIGEWVIETVINQYIIWKSKYHWNLNMAINLSMKQLQHHGLVEKINHILKKTNMNCEKLEFEITESAVMDDSNTTIAVLKKLKELGISIALDDFGTGYSSLNYLRELPIDKLKIDKSFVDAVLDNSNKRAITETIIELAHKMKLSVVAEGVEEYEQLLFLEQNGCDIAQGYYISKPLPASDFEKFMMANGGYCKSFSNGIE